MAIRSASACAHPPCRRTTTDASGRCFDHRGAVFAPGAIDSLTPTPAVDPEVPVVNRFPAGGYEVCHYDGKRLHRLDGPAYELCKADGESRVEWWSDGEPHRLDGPAKIEYRADGSVKSEHWYAHGRVHRVNGPAATYREHDGTVRSSYHYLLGTLLVGSAEEEIASMPTAEIEKALRDSPFAELLDEGMPIETITGALASGVNSAEGMRQVLDGAPDEWVRSWESAAAVESRAAG